MQNQILSIALQRMCCQPAIPDTASMKLFTSYSEECSERESENLYQMKKQYVTWVPSESVPVMIFYRCHKTRQTQETSGLHISTCFEVIFRVIFFCDVNLLMWFVCMSHTTTYTYTQGSPREKVCNFFWAPFFFRDSIFFYVCLFC